MVPVQQTFLSINLQSWCIAEDIFLRDSSMFLDSNVKIYIRSIYWYLNRIQLNGRVQTTAGSCRAQLVSRENVKSVGNAMEFLRN